MGTHSSRVYIAARGTSGANSTSRKAAHDLKKKNTRKDNSRKKKVLFGQQQTLTLQTAVPRTHLGVSYSPSARGQRLCCAPVLAGAA